MRLLLDNTTVTHLELIDCNICPLTCELVGNALVPDLNSYLQVLKLDHNEFGSHGFIGLCKGLCMNWSLQTLSLTYCTIEDDAGPAIRELLINQYSVLNQLDLQGNFLTKEAVWYILHGLQVNPNLTKLGLADNNFGDGPEILQAFQEMIMQNQTLHSIDLRYTEFTEQGVSAIIAMIKEHSDNVAVLGELIFNTSKISLKLRTELDRVLEVNKRGKKPKKIILAET